MCGTFYLRLGLALSCFLFVVVDSGSLIASFTVNVQSILATVNVGSQLTFEGSRVENITNPSWKVVGRYTGTSVLSGGTFMSKSFTVAQPATCAYNDIFDCTATLGGQTETLSVRVNVNNCPSYPPTLPPVVVVYNKTVTDGEVIQVNTSITRDVDIECTVEGGSPAVTNVTLTCDGSSKTINGYGVFFTLTISSGSPNVTCTCSADHVTGLYFKKTSFTFSTGFLFVVVDSGSLIASFTVNDQSTQFSVNVGSLLTFQASRVENITNPSWKVVGRYTGTSVVSGGTFTSKSFTVKVPATCAYNDIFDCTATLGGQTETLSVRVNVNNCPSYPPSLPPVVVVYNKTVTAGETIQLNTSNTKVDIECTVEGGNPEVFSVTLVCGDKSSTVLGNSGLFTLTYSNQKIIPCVCSAFHFSLYNKTTSFTFSTVNNAKNQGLGPSIVWNILLLALVILVKTAIL